MAGTYDIVKKAVVGTLVFTSGYLSLNHQYGSDRTYDRLRPYVQEFADRKNAEALATYASQKRQYDVLLEANKTVPKAAKGASPLPVPQEPVKPALMNAKAMVDQVNTALEQMKTQDSVVFCKWERQARIGLELPNKPFRTEDEACGFQNRAWNAITGFGFVPGSHKDGGFYWDLAIPILFIALANWLHDLLKGLYESRKKKESGGSDGGPGQGRRMFPDETGQPSSSPPGGAAAAPDNVRQLFTGGSGGTRNEPTRTLSIGAAKSEAILALVAAEGYDIQVVRDIEDLVKQNQTFAQIASEMRLSTDSHRELAGLLRIMYNKGAIEALPKDTPTTN